MKSSPPTDEDVKQAVMEAARLQTQVFRRLLNAGSVLLAVALVVAIYFVGGWIADSIGR